MIEACLIKVKKEELESERGDNFIKLCLYRYYSIVLEPSFKLGRPPRLRFTIDSFTTNDCRIRLVNTSDGKLIQKYKGHTNREFMIRGFSEQWHDLVISASEDDMVFVWSRINKESRERKNYHYELFRAFEKDTPASSLFLNEMYVTDYFKKLCLVSNKLLLYSLIINVSVGGRFQVLINVDKVDQ
jgi:hypothetical protein